MSKPTLNDDPADRDDLKSLLEATKDLGPVYMRYQPGSKPNIDQTLTEASAHVATAGGGPLVVRITPQFQFPATPRHPSRYISWSGVTWSLAFEQAAYVSEFRRDLHAFMSWWVAAKRHELVGEPPHPETKAGFVGLQERMKRDL